MDDIKQILISASTKITDYLFKHIIARKEICTILMQHRMYLKLTKGIQMDA